jgi:hypothetical protein
MTDDMVEEHKMMECENDEVTTAARSHYRQCLKCYPVYSQAMCGRGNMLKDLKGCDRYYSYKPLTCERLKTFYFADVLFLHRI